MVRRMPGVGRDEHGSRNTTPATSTGGRSTHACAAAVSPRGTTHPGHASSAPTVAGTGGQDRRRGKGAASHRPSTSTVDRPPVVHTSLAQEIQNFAAQLGARDRDRVLHAHHLRDVADVEGDAEDASHSGSSRHPSRRVASPMSQGSTRPRPSWRRSSSSCANRRSSRSSARRCRRGSSCTDRPAPARRCSRRPSPHESGARVLRPVGGLLRRDVRRPRGGADQAPVRRRPQPRTGDHLHRRARRRRRAPRHGHLGREGPDAQPAAGRDGRLRLQRAGSS